MLRLLETNFWLSQISDRPTLRDIVYDLDCRPTHQNPRWVPTDGARVAPSIVCRNWLAQTGRFCLTLYKPWVCSLGSRCYDIQHLLSFSTIRPSVFFSCAKAHLPHGPVLSSVEGTLPRMWVKRCCPSAIRQSFNIFQPIQRFWSRIASIRALLNCWYHLNDSLIHFTRSYSLTQTIWRNAIRRIHSNGSTSFHDWQLPLKLPPQRLQAPIRVAVFDQ